MVPSLLVMWYFHRRDLFPEPPRVLWLTFGFGILIVIPVLLVAWPAAWLIRDLPSPLAWGLAAAFLQAALPEELFKLLVLRGYSLRRPEFDEPMDGIVYGVAASLGFATLENTLYVAQGGGGVALMRALTAVPSHAFLGAIMGSYAARARFAPAPERGRWMRRALAVPVLLHGLYDFPLLAARRVQETAGEVTPLQVGLIALAPLIVVAEWIWAVRLARRLRVAQILAAGAGLPTAPGRVSSVLLTLGGAAAASVGGLLVLGALLSVLLGGRSSEEAGMIVGATALFGFAPLAGGAAIFVWGVKRLNEGGRGT